jgi:uncharacterized protein (DUF736 family)
VGFTATYYKETTTDHRIDRTKPSHRVQARSLDGGKTWKVEADQPYSDRKNEPEAVALKEPLDFTAPDFAMMFRFKSLHVGPSWFYTTQDRCKTWQGPFKFDVEGVDGISTRTDLIPLGPRECLMFGSCGKKSDNKEGRVFCARTTDGGLTWKLQGYIGEEPPKGGFAIMPSSVRTAGGALLTTLRKGKPDYTIELWRSDDLGKTWSKVSDVTGNIGGNPPATVLLPDGRLCVTYGHRKKPFGIRARISAMKARPGHPRSSCVMTASMAISVIRARLCVPMAACSRSTTSTAPKPPTAPSKPRSGPRRSSLGWQPKPRFPIGSMTDRMHIG